MTIRTILAAASGGDATTGTIDLACQLARRFQAHFEALHVMPDRRAVFAATGEGLAPASVGLVETLMDEITAKAAQTRAVFDDITERHGIMPGTAPQLATTGPSASWREATGDAATLVARHGRFFDLIVLGRSERVVQEPHSDTIERALTLSGRPVLLAPPRPPSGIGYVVAVAWNGSPQAVRALSAALPFLKTANAVSIITAGEEDAGGSLYAIEYLAWHGIAAEHRNVKGGSGRQIGKILLGAAQATGADMLVMGGYGQAPWREQLLGGATRAALASATLPLLMMH